MMKNEFEQRIEEEISEEDFQIVETVYNNYPIQEGAGRNEKDVYADLYKLFGVKIFYDMYPRAKKIAIVKDRIWTLQQQLDHYKNSLWSFNELSDYAGDGFIIHMDK
ncbi:MAG: hypothetical protein PWQ97_474 [Tepidanaerobacteraceae bacterium]|nr:hypothetical protein [Tepidanaerobacteraceae bacterium]